MAYVEHEGGWRVPSLVEDAVAGAFSFDGRTGLGAFRRRAPALALAAAAALGAGAVDMVSRPFAATLAAGFALLLAALTVRRLHDAGRGGWTVAVQGAALAAMVATGAAIHGHSVGLLLGEGLLGAQAALLLAAAALTLRRALREGAPGPNRYGPEPA